MTCCIDTELPSYYDERWHKARKDHRCCECRRPIHPGEQYQYIIGVWDGEFSTFKTCEQCVGVRESLNKVWCAPLGELRLEYLEYLGEMGRIEFDEDDQIVWPVNHLIRRS